MSLFEIMAVSAVSFTAIYFLMYLGFAIWDKILDYREKKEEDDYNEDV